MTPEVKKRIEQIRQGIVPEGYKKTESGIIPNEWRVEQVSKCIEEYKFFSNDISHIPVYSSSRKGLVPQSDYYNQREAVETNLGYKVVPQGYVTYRHMSDDDVFHFNINKTGENVLVSSEYPVFTSSDNCDLSFLISVLNNTARFRYFCKMQKLGGTRTRLYLDNLKRYALALPPFDEQKKIAEILSTQDKAIELQGRKIEELKRFKKGCLEKMFPRKGQKVPEKRFPGFTDDWEQRKLGELCAEFKSGDFISAEEIFLGGNYPVYGGNGLRGYTNRYNHDGDFALVGRQGALCGNMNYSSGKAYFTEHAIAVQANKTNDTRFLFYCFGNMNLGQFSGQSAQPGLAVSKLIELTTFVPSKAEQEKISTALTIIDHLITLHQRKGKAAVTGCSNDANNSKGVYCKARDFGYKCYKEVKSQQIRCLIAVFIFCV